MRGTKRKDNEAGDERCKGKQKERGKMAACESYERQTWCVRATASKFLREEFGFLRLVR